MSSKQSSALKSLTLRAHESGYRIVYGKGTFNSGYCLLKDHKVIVINKFFDDKNKLQIIKSILEEISMEEPIAAFQDESE